MFSAIFGTNAQSSDTTTTTTNASVIVVDAIPVMPVVEATVYQVPPTIPVVASVIDLTPYVSVCNDNDSTSEEEMAQIPQATAVSGAAYDPLVAKYEEGLIEGLNGALETLYNRGANLHQVEQIMNNIVLVNLAGCLHVIGLHEQEDMATASQTFCHIWSTQGANIRQAINYDLTMVSGGDLRAGRALLGELSSVNEILRNGPRLEDVNESTQDYYDEVCSAAHSDALSLLYGVFTEVNHNHN